MTGLRGKSFFFLNIFQLSHANELPNKLNEFCSLKFLWGIIRNSLLPLQHMKPGMKTNLATAPFMEYWFHTDARPWALLCCQTLIPALLLHYNWDTSRGDMYIRVCVNLKPSAVNYTVCVCACVCMHLDSYPSMGCSAMARGFSMFCHSSTLRCVPSRFATSIRDVPESVQYNLSWIQSMASPPKEEENQFKFVWGGTPYVFCSFLSALIFLNVHLSH